MMLMKFGDFALPRKMLRGIKRERRPVRMSYRK
jgi:hypothetical protein